MADILPTAQGTLSGDIEQIKTARFGRDVRASIAEALEIVGGDHDTVVTVKKEMETVKTDISSIENSLKNNTAGWISAGGLYPIYQWLDGTTTLDKITENPNLAGTDVQIGSDIFTYAKASGTPGALVFKEHLASSTPVGASNKYGHSLACGYKITDARMVLYDTDENIITEDSDGDLEQGAILYDKTYGVKGFKTDRNTKVYIQDLLNRIAALEAKVK